MNIEKIEKIINSIRNPYPVEIFPEIPDEVPPAVHDFLKEKFGISLDDLSAHIGRIVFECTKKVIIRALKEELEGEKKEDK